MPGRHGTSAVPQDGIFVSFEKTTKEEKKSFLPKQHATTVERNGHPEHEFTSKTGVVRPPTVQCRLMKFRLLQHKLK